MSIQALCKQCDAEFTTSTSNVKKGYGIFCSRSCNRSYHNKGSRNPSWNNGVSTMEGYDRIHKRLYNERYPEKNRANKKVYKAIHCGKLVKPSTCSKCFVVSDSLEAHHEDYSKPLDIVWVCKACHVEADKLRRLKDPSNRSLDAP